MNVGRYFMLQMNVEPYLTLQMNVRPSLTLQRLTQEDQRVKYKY